MSWSGRGCPSPAELVADKVFTLANEMVHPDPTLNPRHSRIVCALLAEHDKGKCIFFVEEANVRGNGIVEDYVEGVRQV